jgi:hypothetical protein
MTDDELSRRALPTRLREPLNIRTRNEEPWSDNAWCSTRTTDRRTPPLRDHERSKSDVTWPVTHRALGHLAARPTRTRAAARSTAGRRGSRPRRHRPQPQQAEQQPGHRRRLGGYGRLHSSCRRRHGTGRGRRRQLSGAGIEAWARHGSAWLGRLTAVRRRRRAGLSPALRYLSHSRSPPE